MQTTSINFGTSVHIGTSQQDLLVQQSERFLNGFILAEKKMSGNRIKDALILNIERQADNKNSDVLTLSYKSPEGVFNPNFIIKNIKDLPRRTKKIEQFFLDSLKKLQTPEAKIRTVHLTTSKEQDKATLKNTKVDYLINKIGFDDNFSA